MATATQQLSKAGGAAAEKHSSLPRLRILFLIDEIGGPYGGGTERQVLQLIQLAKRLGYEPRLAVLRGTGWLREDHAGCPVYCAGITRLFSSSGWRGSRKLIQWMRAERIVLVQTFFAECNILGPFLARMAAVPVVIGARRNLEQWVDRMGWRSPAVRYAQRLANRFTDCVVANSQVVADTVVKVKGVPRRKIRVAHNGIDLARFSAVDRSRAGTRKMLGIAEDEILVGNISCLRPEKGLLQFVEAARLVLEKDPGMRFLLIGGGEQLNILAERIRQYGLEDRVRLAGAQKDVLPYLAAMDIGVLSSLEEGFSNALLEYMAVGLPVIATEVGGNREALGDSGILIPSDDPAALADALLRLRSPAMRRRLGEAALQRVQRFSLERAERRMEEIYSEMLNRKGIAPPKNLKEKNPEWQI